MFPAQLVRVKPSILTRMPGRIVTSAPPGFDWYVDSVAGNDGNSGRTPSQAFQSLAAVNAVLSAGDRIGLKRGSTWYEKLTLQTGCKVAAYGGGARPIIECRDAIGAGAWTKSGGYTNVYQATVTFDAGILDDPELHVWEDGAPYLQQTSIANVDANPGSFYVASSFTSPQTVYIHAFGSTNPTSDGKTRLYNPRAYAVGSTNAVDRLIIRDVHAIGNLRGDGAIVCRDYSQVINCVLEWGGKHEVYLGEGSIAANCTFYDSIDATSATMLVFNKNTPTGQNNYVINCTFKIRSAYANAHRCGPANSHNNVSGSFGTVYFRNCRFENFTGARMPMNHHTHVRFEDCTWLNCGQGLDANSTNTSITVSGGSWESNVLYQRMININASGGACVLRIENFTIKPTAVTDTGFVYLNQACIVQLSNVTFDLSGLSAGLRRCIYLTNTGANLTYEDCSFLGHTTAGATYVDLNVTPASWAADRNSYRPTAAYWRLAPTTYTTLANWQAAVTPREANSVTL